MSDAEVTGWHCKHCGKVRPTRGLAEFWCGPANITPVRLTKPKAAPLDDVGNDSGDTEKNEVKT